MTRSGGWTVEDGAGDRHAYPPDPDEPKMRE